MTTFINLSTISVVFDGVPDQGTSYIRKTGTGQLYTYKVYGTPGQSVEIRGGFLGDVWENMQQIAVLTVSGTESHHNVHAWTVIAVQGTAEIKIARGQS